MWRRIWRSNLERNSEMLEPIKSIRVAEVLTNPELNRMARINALKELRRHMHEEQRGASEREDTMATGQLNAELRDIERALERLDRRPSQK
jgi:hypothetical protein